VLVMVMQQLPVQWLQVQQQGSKAGKAAQQKFLAHVSGADCCLCDCG
jgi:hypothetical protein